MNGLAEAIAKLRCIEGFCLYALNIWTDPDAGVSEFSAESREHSEKFSRELQAWNTAEAEQLRAAGREELAKAVDRPYPRNVSPADFEYKGLVKIDHLDWESVSESAKKRDLVERVVVKVRDHAARSIGEQLDVDPEAEVSVGTWRDWYDLAVPIRPKANAR